MPQLSDQHAATTGTAAAIVIYDRHTGYYVEFYRDDDGNSGNGDHPRAARWYGDRAECDALVKSGNVPGGLQWTSPEWRPDDAPGGAGWCETFGDAA